MLPNHSFQLQQRKTIKRAKQQKFLAKKREAATKLRKKVTEEKQKFYQQFSNNKQK